MQVAALIGLGLGQVNRRQNPCSIGRNPSNLFAFSHVCLTGGPNGAGNAYLAGQARCVTSSSQPEGSPRRAPNGRKPMSRNPHEPPQSQVPQSQVPRSQVPQSQVPQPQVPQDHEPDAMNRKSTLKEVSGCHDGCRGLVGAALGGEAATGSGMKAWHRAVPLALVLAAV